VLGEGVRWDDRRAELLHVDILAGLVLRNRVDDDGAMLPITTYQLPGTVGAVAPIEGDAGWLLPSIEASSTCGPTVRTPWWPRWRLPARG
jgi:sugar lactone lactonase YvrE